MVQTKLFLLLVVCSVYFSVTSSVKIGGSGSKPFTSTSEKPTKSLLKRADEDSRQSRKKVIPSRKVEILAQSGVLSKIASRLPFRKVVPVIAKVLGKPPSSLAKINILMLMFYTTLGAAMPFIPLYYRHIGLSSEKTVKMILTILHDRFN
jgi:hypothetical protein